jgi:hypothetical protein
MEERGENTPELLSFSGRTQIYIQLTYCTVANAEKYTESPT